MSDITSLSQLDQNANYTYADYMTWKLKERVELYKGKIFKMSPAPSRLHQQISVYMTVQLYNYLKKTSCSVYEAPFDVRLPVSSGKKPDTVVQPDICVICDPAILDDAGCNGAPDLMIEILSPGNSKKEMDHKFKLYEASGVKEYWLINYQDEVVHQYILKEERFVAYKPLTIGDNLKSIVLPDFSLFIEQLFDQK